MMPKDDEPTVKNYQKHKDMSHHRFTCLRTTNVGILKYRQLNNPPSIRVFSSESARCMRWRKYWSFSFNISPSKEHPGLLSFRMDWLDLLAVQGTLKSLLQQHSFKSINSSALSFLHSPTLTSIHDHWKSHSLN